MPAKRSSTAYPIYDVTVSVPTESAMLEGRLTVPATATQIVIFAHGSGSSRFSPRNWYVAEVLHGHNIATLLIDLLTEAEGQEDMRTGHLRFNIPLLATRLANVAAWVHATQETRHLHIGYFGSSTGAGAALIAAADSDVPIAAIVSRGGRPDMAGDYLPAVKAPTLLIVGGFDTQVLALNEQALAHLNNQSRIEVIPGATHLFEEPGTLEQVALKAAEWFKHHTGVSHALP
ncbi:dienelactone hydrolase family protein [Kordiimonas sp. A6E486]|nr:dienelactone hydrolase family protein [Kordiimonas marina]